MEPGAHVWCRDPDPQGDLAWILVEVLSKTPDEIKLAYVEDPSKTVTRKREEVPKEDEDVVQTVKYEGVELANAPLSEAEVAEGRDDDLIALPHLHEPALLHAISERFLRGSIYTYTGPVLIAVNPFQRLPLYTEQLLEQYRRDGLLRSQNFQPKKKLMPHVYSIADRSYRQMMRSATEAKGGEAPNPTSQSILISGESGAGKTETTKIVMLYLTTLGSSLTEAKDGDGEATVGKADTSIMERVLQSNPILEAFGNARTLRNDNSSRFGKLIELGFSRAGVLLGAKVQTYLLEKVRVGFHASGERNYHIFYQLVRGADHDMLKKMHFHEAITGGLELSNHLNYTGQGGAPQLREFTDEEGLQYTLKAMKKMKWPQDKIDTVLNLVAGLLHLGQVTFEQGEHESGLEIAVVSDDEIVKNSAELLGVDVEKLRSALLERAVVTRSETIMSQLTPGKALDARDALAKTIYGALFLWVVDQVNQCIGWEDDKEVRSSIGVLDIFGFECFAVNSFEQLCINYTNEALQQQFNKFIFKMEQAEYETEKIEWEMISFPDNQDCLDLIHSKPNGLLSQLDDECRLGQRGSDRNWANRLYKTYTPNRVEKSENGRFQATAIQKGKAQFCVRHFAGLVTYSSNTGFLEKNKDEIPLTAKYMFDSAPSQLIKDIMEVQMREIMERAPPKPTTPANGRPAPRPKAAKSKTVAMQFKEQLASLMKRVESTEPHYIRCLKPNDAAKPKMLTRKRLTEQLRYGGVLEAVRVARMGYPVRLDHGSFFQRYRMVLPSVSEDVLPWNLEDEDVEPQALCVRLVDTMLKQDPNASDENSRAAKIRSMQSQPPKMNFPKSDVQLGASKIFMRKTPHDILEAHRVFHQSASVTLLQAFLRGMTERRAYLMQLTAAQFIQCVYRGSVGRARWWRLREAQAGHLLTNNFRMQKHRWRYNAARKGTVQLQAGYRGFVCRRNIAAGKIQTSVRMHSKKYAYSRLKSAVIALQTTQRGRVARRDFAELKREQKDIGKLKENNERMKAEMAGLKAMLAALAKGEESKRETDGALEEKEKQIAALEKRVAELESELEKEKALVKRLEAEVEELQKRPPVTVVQQQPQQHHNQQLRQPVPPPKYNRIVEQENIPQVSNVSSMQNNVANAALIAEHKAQIARLEQELEAERSRHREADGEIIKLRAEINGVRLEDKDVQALLAPVDGKVAPPPVKPDGDEAVESDESRESEEAGESEQEQETEENKGEAGTVEKEAGAEVVSGEGQKGEVEVEMPKDRSKITEISGRGAEIAIVEEEGKREEEPLAVAVAVARPIVESPIVAVKNAARKMKQEVEVRLEPEKQPSTPTMTAALTMLGIMEPKEKPKPAPKPKEKPKLVSKPKVERQPSLQEKVEKALDKPFFTRSASEYFPMVKRGFTGSADDAKKEEEEIMAVGWQVDITTRKEREEALRDEVRRFEIKTRRFKHALEEGLDVTLWQLNRNQGADNEGDSDEFALKATPVSLKLQKRGDLLVQMVLTFNTRGGYLSKALGRGQKSAMDPLPLHEILEVKAGCFGYDQAALPPARPGKEGKGKKGSDSNKHSSLFLTLKASPNPMANMSRSYFLRLKSRSARNDLLRGLRGILADLQIHEGIGISSIHTPQSPNRRRLPDANYSAAHSANHLMENGDSDMDIMIPLVDVHREMNKERKAYDRLLLLMLQSNSDLKEKEDEILHLRGKLDLAKADIIEKEKTQVNDSKLIMQLSKKLEMLLMDNEDLRDQNDRLNGRLVAVECEKMNLMSSMQS